MAPQTTLPQLPVELLTEIIATTWTMPLTPQERLTFMKSSILVNSTWAAIYDPVSARDVYIPSFAYCKHFLRPLRQRRTPDAERDDWLVPAPAPSIFQRLTSLFWVKDAPEDQNNTIPDLACRSITIQVVGTRDGGSKLPPWTGWVLELLDALGETLAPNLRRLCVEYVNVAPDSAALALAALASLPEQITHLELRFSAPDTTLGSEPSLRGTDRMIQWRAPSVRNLTVFGAGEEIVRSALEACPNVQVLHVDTRLECRWLKSLNRSVQVVYCQ